MNQTGINLDHRRVEACDVKPPETHRYSTLQLQLRRVFASREGLSHERNFCPLSRESVSEHTDCPQTLSLRCSFLFLSFLSYVFCSHSQLYKWMLWPDWMPCVVWLWEFSYVYPFVCMDLQYVCVCACVGWNVSMFPPLSCSWMQLFGLFNIHVYIPDLERRQDMDDGSENMSWNISKLTTTRHCAAAVFPH